MKLFIMAQTTGHDLIMVEQEWQHADYTDRRKLYAEAKRIAKEKLAESYPGYTISKTTVIGENLTEDDVSKILMEEVIRVQKPDAKQAAINYLENLKNRDLPDGIIVDEWKK